MKLSLVPLLSCPTCSADLRVSTVRSFPGNDMDVEEGMLTCSKCGREYPISSGIPRLRPHEDLAAPTAKTRSAFGWEWLRYPGSRPVDKDLFLEETMLEPAALAGKRVLDAGCGMGRYSAVAAACGAEVVAVDMSESLVRVAEAAKKIPTLHPVEGDLLQPPFKKSVFDAVYSQGVLHHTADTHRAFCAVARLVKRGGFLSVWLYGKAGHYRDFCTNPLRPGREWIARHRRLAWFVVLLRHVISDCVRCVTTRLPIPFVYGLCRPLAALGAVPGIKWFTYSVDPDYRVRLIENFDWISPPYQWHHTKEELARWYADEGFDVIKVLAHGLVPKPGILGRRSTG